MKPRSNQTGKSDTPSAPTEPVPYDGNKLIFMDVSNNQLVSLGLASVGRGWCRLVGLVSVGCFIVVGIGTYCGCI